MLKSTHFIDWQRKYSPIHKRAVSERSNSKQMNSFSVINYRTDEIRSISYKFPFKNSCFVFSYGQFTFSSNKCFHLSTFLHLFMMINLKWAKNNPLQRNILKNIGTDSIFHWTCSIPGEKFVEIDWSLRCSFYFCNLKKMNRKFKTLKCSIHQPLNRMLKIRYFYHWFLSFTFSFFRCHR